MRDPIKSNLFGTSVIKVFYGPIAGDPARIVTFKHNLQVAINVQRDSVHLVAEPTEEKDIPYRG